MVIYDTKSLLYWPPATRLFAVFRVVVVVVVAVVVVVVVVVDVVESRLASKLKEMLDPEDRFQFDLKEIAPVVI